MRRSRGRKRSLRRGLIARGGRGWPALCVRSEISCRVRVEETLGLQRERGVHHGHDGEVLRQGVRQASTIRIEKGEATDEHAHTRTNTNTNTHTHTSTHAGAQSYG